MGGTPLTSARRVAISVVMPVYNAGAYLRPAIESVLAQTFGDFELILIDDAATDGSGVVCDEYAARNARVRVRHGRNGGICASRNAGLAIARGEWVAFCDHDDFLEREALEIAFRAVTGPEINLVKFNHRTERRRAGGTTVVEFAGVDRADCDFRVCDLLTARSYPFFKSLTGLVWDGLYRRSFLEGHGLRFDESFRSGGEDFDFMTRLLAVLEGGVWINRVLYRHYYNVGTSTSAKYHPELLEDFLRVARLERRLFDFTDPALCFVSFAEWTVFVIHFVFAVRGCPLSIRDQGRWLALYAAELAPDAGTLSGTWLPLKRRFLLACLKLRWWSVYVLAKRALLAWRWR